MFFQSLKRFINWIAWVLFVDVYIHKLISIAFPQFFDDCNEVLELLKIKMFMHNLCGVPREELTHLLLDFARGKPCRYFYNAKETLQLHVALPFFTDSYACSKTNFCMNLFPSKSIYFLSLDSSSILEALFESCNESIALIRP